jgi:hypothetical protein
MTCATCGTGNDYPYEAHGCIICCKWSSCFSIFRLLCNVVDNFVYLCPFPLATVLSVLHNGFCLPFVVFKRIGGLLSKDVTYTKGYYLQLGLETDTNSQLWFCDRGGESTVSIVVLFQIVRSIYHTHEG